MMKIAFFLIIGGITPLFSSLSLYNDSNFTLKVKVIGANGAKVGEEKMAAHSQFYMEDQIGTSDPVGQGDDNASFENYEDSITPYQVFWYCLEGTLYSACLDASAGATVTANTCQGSYGCK